VAGALRARRIGAPPSGPEGRIGHHDHEGDRILDRSLAKVGGKGLFIKELEQGCSRTASISPCIP